MPLPRSCRGTRASPASTTIRTPLTVSDDSAMSVLSTTRRRPIGDGINAVSCSANDSAPASSRTSTSAPTRSARNCSTRRISPIPGRKTSTSPTSSLSAAQHSIAGCLFDARALHHRQPSKVDRVRATDALDGRRVAEDSRQLGDIGRRRHGQQAQIGTHRVARIESERQPDVGGHVAFVHLVEDHQADARQLRVVLQPPRQHTFGHDLDPCARPDVAFVAGLIPDQSTDLGSEQRGHSLGGGACRQSARLEHHDSARQPRLLDQPQRRDRGLACTRRRDRAEPTRGVATLPPVQEGPRQQEGRGLLRAAPLQPSAGVP